MKRSVQTAGLRIQKLGNNIHISRLEFCKLPVFQHQARQFVLLCELLKDLDGCRILARFAKFAWTRQVELIEKDFAKLTRRVDVELAIRDLADPLGQFVQLSPHLMRHPFEHTHINTQSSQFHFHKHGRQRQLDLPIWTVDVLLHFGGEILEDTDDPGSTLLFWFHGLAH